MKDKEIQETIKQFNIMLQYSEDQALYSKCRNMVQNYVRNDAISLLNALANRYESEINQISFLFGGRYVIHGVDFSIISDIEIIDQLIYIGQRIPVYAFIREGEKYSAEKLLKQIGCSGFIF